MHCTFSKWVVLATPTWLKSGGCIVGSFRVGDEVIRSARIPFGGLKVGDIVVVASTSGNWFGVEGYDGEEHNDHPFCMNSFKLVVPKAPDKPCLQDLAALMAKYGVQEIRAVVKLSDALRIVNNLNKD